MATKVQNDQGFLAIRMEPDEAFNLGWGTPDGLMLCMSCNENITDPDDVYYVAVLGDVLCRNCYEEWYKTAIRYSEDIPYEKREYNRIADKLNLEKA